MANGNDKNILDPSAASQSGPTASVNNVIEVLYGSDDIKKAYPIPTNKIDKIQIKESFFSKLPTLKLVLSDVGTLFNTVGFQIGYTINVKITPIVRNKDVIPRPYVNSNFTIQSINYVFDMDKKYYVYELNCIYPAEKYLNDICVWPITEIDALNIEKQYTSEALLRLICTRGGLGFYSNLTTEPSDSMAWLNCSLTYSEFAEKVTKHAWVGDNDMPILYVNKEGTAIYNTLNTMCNGATKYTYIQKTLYDMKYRPTGNNPNRKPSGYRTFTDMTFNNIGYIQNQGAYGVKTYIYNPYNLKSINPLTIKPAVPKNIKNVTLNDACLRYKEFHDNKIRVAQLSNKSPGQVKNFRYSFSKMHFKQTHENYDYAPQHNESIKRAFFQQFVSLTVDAVNQPDYDFDPLQMVYLGDKINVRVDTTYNPGTIQSGDYIVTGLVHNFYTKSNYTINIIAANDGINGVGQLKKESDINKK